MNSKDFALLDAFKTNKEIPMREFYRAEFPKARNFILKNGGTVENSKDIFQEAYLACWKKLSTGQFEPKNKTEIEAYLFTIAKNKWIDLTRGGKRGKTISMDERNLNLAVDEPVQGNECESRDKRLSLTLSAFESLGEPCKDLLTQFYFYKIPLRAIAKKLDMEEASAKNKKYRCIQKLKEIALRKEKTL